PPISPTSPTIRPPRAIHGHSRPTRPTPGAATARPSHAVIDLPARRGTIAHQTARPTPGPMDTKQMSMGPFVSKTCPNDSKGLGPFWPRDTWIRPPLIYSSLYLSIYLILFSQCPMSIYKISY